jgi:hypothetical protein
MWYNKFNKVKLYIDLNNKRPSQRDIDKDIKQLGQWFNHQQTQYKKNIMKTKEIYDNWTKFINDEKYIEYFMSNKELWYNKFNKLISYIDVNNKIPSHINKDIKQLGSWVYTQQRQYKKKTYIMKNKEIYDTWTKFINDEKYIKYFISNEELWYNKLDEVISYIDINNKRPSLNDTNKYIKQLGQWFDNQQSNYKKKEKIMKINEIYNTWTKFIKQ